MKETIEGTLHVKRVQRRTGRLLEDALFPRFYKHMSAYVTAGEEYRPGHHRTTVGLRGKILGELLTTDDGAFVRVTGVARWNPRFGPLTRLGAMTQVSIEWLGERAATAKLREGTG